MGTRILAAVLCILTSFWMLSVPKSWSNYFFLAAFKLLTIILITQLFYIILDKIYTSLLEN